MPLGPRGLLGIPPRTFREKTSFAGDTTHARITQVGFGSWSNFNPVARVTQVNVAVWRTTDDKLRRLANVYYL